MFRVYKTDDGRTVPLEYMPCGAITPKLGMALAMSGGVLAAATGTTKPQYISMVERDAACTAGETIPVIRVGGDIIFETTNSAAFGSESEGVVTTTVKPGSKVTIHTDGAQVTATTTGGIAEVVAYDDYAAGSRVFVRF